MTKPKTIKISEGRRWEDQTIRKWRNVAWFLAFLLFLATGTAIALAF